jgi:hypothetical protein
MEKGGLPSLRQVFENTESSKRQYTLRDEEFFNTLLGISLAPQLIPGSCKSAAAATGPYAPTTRFGVRETRGEVRVNGRVVGIVWKMPFKLDVTEAVKAGVNTLEVEVSNLWANRMIGDKQPGATPIAYATHDPFKADSPLHPSGLLGPVSLTRIQMRALSVGDGLRSAAP